MIIKYTGELNDENFGLFLEDIQDKKGFDFWFSSPGGELTVAYAMLAILEKCEATLIAYGELSSAAFILFLLYKGEKRITPMVEGMMHMGFYFLEHRENGYTSEYQEDIRNYRKLRESAFFDSKKEEWQLTKKQIADYKKGKDVYIPFEQIQNIINEQSKKKNSEESNKISNRINRRTKRSKEVN